MLRSFEDLTGANLATLGFADPAHAATLLQNLAGHGVPDARFEALLPSLAEALARSADPDRAARNLGAWLASVGSRSLYYALLAEHPAALYALVTVLSTSQFLSDILIRNPEYFEVLANPAIRDRARTADDFAAEAARRIAIARTPGARRDALRRFKPPEVLRIGARDILGYADVPGTVAEISAFAEACLQAAVGIAGAESGLAVIAMGKLGGRELNYASDIDLVFVHSDDVLPQEAVRLAGQTQDILAHRTEAGIVFRVDLRLRPEGRFGPISRSLSACRAYYESWAENWERQSLIKARFIAGDAAVGDAFAKIVQPFVYRHHVEERFVEDIRANKRQIEKKTARAGESGTNVKEGVGGIRDVEFAVQLLQLVAGGAHPNLRTGNTLEALDALAELALISGNERNVLRDSYLFLRHVEHRLQIMEERPVRNIPATGSREIRSFGRSLGYADGEEFLADYRARTSQVSTLFGELFYGAPPGSPIIGGAGFTTIGGGGGRVGRRELSDWVRTAGEPRSSQAALVGFLQGSGFADPKAAYDILRFSQAGSDYGAIPPLARERFANLAPRLLSAAAATVAPDAALRGIDSLALAVPSRSALYLSMIEDEDLVERLCRLAAGAPVLWQALLDHLEYLDMLTDDVLLEAPSAQPAIDRAASQGETAEPLAAFLRRERLRIGALDIWGLATPAQVMDGLTDAAEAAIASGLGTSRLAGDMAVIGMGKLGGAELNYASDLDILWVVSDSADWKTATQAAEQAMALLRQDLKRFGAGWEIDARLRPEGQSGALVRSVEGYAAYYQSAGETWEKQALIKARPVAGSAALGEQFMALARSVVYETPLTEAQAGEMRHMKQRIERERAKGAGDVKLGPGGISDIEWIAQMLQWRHGKRWKRAQTPGTLPALAALRDAGMLRQDHWELLTETYLSLVQWRNRRWLATGREGDSSEPQPPDLVEKRRQVREVFERQFLGKERATAKEGE